MTNSLSSSPSLIRVSSISLPGSIFQQVNTTTNSTGLVFTLYRESTLFPVGRRTLSSSNTAVTQVGSQIIAASIVQDTIFENLQDLVTVQLWLELNEMVGDYTCIITSLHVTLYIQDFLLPGSEVCVSWDFNLLDWNRTGCWTIVGKNGTITCACNHLTNFAVLVVSL